MEIWYAPPVRGILRTIHEMDKQAHLVGGVVRDHLLGRPQYVDLDLAVKGDGYEISRHLTKIMGKGATFVPLDKQSGTGRVVMSKQSSFTIDISSFKGENILEDLGKRDFTINAIAVNLADFLDTGFDRVLDPCGGMRDLEARKIRACSENSFRDDPVRILRAFRFSACLGFEIVRETLELIPLSVAELDRMASERIRDEIFAVISEPCSFEAFKDMDTWGVLDLLFPGLDLAKGCVQNDYHHLDVWGHSLETLHRLEVLLDSLRNTVGDLSDQISIYVEEEPVRGRPRLALLKLAALFHDMGKVQTRTVDADDRVRFFGHEKISRQLFYEIGKRLRLAKREIETIEKWIGGHMRPSILAGETVSKRALHRLFREFGREVIGLLLLFLADIGASRGPGRAGFHAENACAAVRMALDEYFRSQQTRKPMFLNGNDLMNQFGIEQGPLLGKIIRLLGELQDSGEISTREQAVSAVMKLYSAEADLS